METSKLVFVVEVETVTVETLGVKGIERDLENALVNHDNNTVPVYSMKHIPDLQNTLSK